MASLGFLGRELWRQSSGLPPVHWSWTGGAALGVALAVALGSVGIYALVWKLLLAAAAVDVPLPVSFAIMARAGIAKYLPGNIAQYVGRVAVGRAYGLPLDAIIASTIAETVLTLCGAGLVAGLSFWRIANAARQMSSWTPIGARGALLVAGVALLGGMLYGRRGRQWIASHAAYLAPRRAGAVVALVIVEFLLFGASMKLLLVVLWANAGAVSWLDLAAGFAAAWTLGFLVPGAPGGIGVRELLLYLLFAQDLGSAVAPLILVMRFATMAADVMAWASSYFLVWPGASPEGRPHAVSPRA